MVCFYNTSAVGVGSGDWRITEAWLLVTSSAPGSVKYPNSRKWDSVIDEDTWHPLRSLPCEVGHIHYHIWVCILHICLCAQVFIVIFMVLTIEGTALLSEYESHLIRKNKTKDITAYTQMKLSTLRTLHTNSYSNRTVLTVDNSHSALHPYSLLSS